MKQSFPYKVHLTPDSRLLHKGVLKILWTNQVITFLPAFLIILHWGNWKEWHGKVHHTVQNTTIPTALYFLIEEELTESIWVQSVSTLQQQQQQHWCVFRHIQVFRCRVHEQSRGPCCTSLKSINPSVQESHVKISPVPRPNAAVGRLFLLHLYDILLTLFIFFCLICLAFFSLNR